MDQSGVELCVTRTLRPNTATTFPFSATADAPANRMTVNESVCTVTSTEPVTLLARSPHMHQLAGVLIFPKRAPGEVALAGRAAPARGRPGHPTVRRLPGGSGQPPLDGWR